MIKKLSLLAVLTVSVLAYTACGGGEDDDGGPTGAECPDDSTLTYANFGQQFFADYCNSCHASDQVGDDRGGAPVGYDFNTLAGVMMHADHIDEVSGKGPDATNTIMPPGANKPSDSEREDLAEWIACGTPP